MFDTIKMLARNIHISPEKLNQQNIKSLPNFNKRTGEMSTKYEVRKGKIPYSVYFESTKTLLIQVSIPKFLYGDNITLIKESDISEFFIQLNGYFRQLFDVDIPDDTWFITSRIDVCWNFNVGGKVSDYINQISKNKLQYKQTILYNHTETVYFQNKSSKIKFYDKQKETIAHKEPREIINSANGVVRLEISPSVNDIKKYCKSKQATKLLTKVFFERTTKQVLSQITIPEKIEELEYEWLRTQKIQNIEKWYVFLKLMDSFNELILQELYGQVFKNRKDLINRIEFPKSKKLDKLNIDYNGIA